jgi:hypothetical protein
MVMLRGKDVLYENSRTHSLTRHCLLKNKILAVTLATSLVFCTFSVQANASSAAIESAEQEFTFSMDGRVGTPTESKLTGPKNLRELTSSEMLGTRQGDIAVPALAKGNVTIAFGDAVTIRGTASAGSEVLDITLNGRFYPFDSGYYENNMILGDFKAEQRRITVKSIRVDKVANYQRMDIVSKRLDGEAVITFSLVDNFTDKQYYVQSVISKSVYSQILSLSHKFRDEFFSDGHTQDDYNRLLVGLDLGQQPESIGSGESDPVTAGTSLSSATNLSDYLGDDQIKSRAASTQAAASVAMYINDLTKSELEDLLVAIKGKPINSKGIPVADYGVTPFFFKNSAWDIIGACSAWRLPVNFMGHFYK